MAKDIFDFCKEEKSAYETIGVTVAADYEWHMPERIKKNILYKDGQLLSGKDENKPVKNIILPILNVSYRSEGFDVKDIELYVDNPDKYYMSLIIRKYHDQWAIKNGIDTFIDDIVESYVDFGGVLVKNVKDVRPEVIPLQKLAFCDQTDILSGPFAIKHQYSIDQLKEKSDVWDAEAINDVIVASMSEKTNDQSNGRKSKTPGKYIEIFEIHGMFPISWLSENEIDYNEQDEYNYSRQIHIICYNTHKDNYGDGACLFKGKEKDGLFKVLKRDSRYATALGRSAIEELEESQVWTNYNLIQIKMMLDKAALMIGITDDPSFNTKNRFTDLEQGEWLVKQPNTDAQPFIFPAQNIQQFENAVIQWENHARTTGSANDAQLGENPTSGTPFKLQALVVNEGEGIHKYRRGKIAVFVEEIYRDWIMDDIVSDMMKGKVFLSELSIDELNDVVKNVVNNHVNTIIKKNLLSGKPIFKEEQEQLIQKFSDDFKSKGTKKFLELFKDEMKDVSTDVKINVAGKQKDLALLVDKLSNIVKQVMANPAILQDPNMAKLLNTIFEASGIPPINFQPVPPVPQGQVSPLQINQPTLK